MTTQWMPSPQARWETAWVAMQKANAGSVLINRRLAERCLDRFFDAVEAEINQPRYVREIRP